MDLVKINSIETSQNNAYPFIAVNSSCYTNGSNKYIRLNFYNKTYKSIHSFGYRINEYNDEGAIIESTTYSEDGINFETYYQNENVFHQIKKDCASIRIYYLYIDYLDYKFENDELIFICNKKRNRVALDDGKSKSIHATRTKQYPGIVTFLSFFVLALALSIALFFFYILRG